MYIKELSLSDFRNYENLVIQLDHGINIFRGDNAQGKTNILESIYLCATARSHRTHKEKEIITLVAEGMNNKEIAEKLFLSEGTVRNYLSSILEKLEVRDRTQLVVYYYKHCV